MYIPAHFRQEDRGEALELVRRIALAELVTWDGSSIAASTIPMFYDPSPGGEGSLLGHVARGNPQWSTYDPRAEALAIFRGPQAYISPSWYPSKAEHGKVVPTWNYVAVHIHGELVVHDDEEWKRALVTRLTEVHESGRERPWSVGMAPEEYITAQLRAIVGIELRISRLEAKWKLSQNQPDRNRAGVVEGLQRDATPAGLEVAEMIRGLRQ